MTDIVITAATRTAIGSFNGALATVPAVELGATVIRELLKRGKVSASEVDDVIFGNVLTAGLGQNPARQAALNAGLPATSTAITINQVCGSGLRAVAMGLQTLLCGDASVVIAGGQENMSLAPHAIYLRSGIKMGPGAMTDTMIKDGLWDAFNDFHMGMTAENVAGMSGITRETQDNLAAQSQQRAASARENGHFTKEIVPVSVRSRKGETVVEEDEYIRPGTTAEKLSTLRPAFSKDGSVTAGNASGLNDGAAGVVMMRATEAESRGLKPLARIAGWATAGVDPAIMGTGPIAASRKLLNKIGWTSADLDLIEANEAFAAQAAAVTNEMGWDPKKVNVNGGAIALGHPIGASGARILVTLLHEMERRDARKGLATLCIGGGMGVALCVERP